jgi:hypothetical protein
VKTARAILAIAIGALVLLAFILPATRRAKIGGGPPCIASLKVIQNAKSMCAHDLGLTNEVSFTREQLLPYFGGRWPSCPKGGQYTIGSLHESPRCSYPAHVQLKVATK